MKDVNEKQSRNVRTQVIYVERNEAVHTQYIAARIVVMLIIILVLLSGRSLDWNMLLKLWPF
jgi:hypothetical protein